MRPIGRTSLFATITTVLFGLGCAAEYDLKAQEEPARPGEDEEVHAEETDSADPVEEEDDDPLEGEDDTEPGSDKPVAVCDVSPNPVTPPFEAATWFGSDSYDPEGYDIAEYDWTLSSAPSGSAVSFPSGLDADRTPFVPDLAGDYIGTLIVTTTDGRVSEPCEVTLESIPAENLWIEMYWTEAPDDMDLHLLAPGGSYNDWSSDCYYANCTGMGLEWGASGNSDNPVLDLDDIPGTGPENINIGEPESGTYTVLVHDYNGSNGWGADVKSDNEVTVNIYIDGALQWSDTKAIAGDDTKTSFAEIDWATGTVTSL